MPFLHKQISELNQFNEIKQTVQKNQESDFPVAIDDNNVVNNVQFVARTEYQEPGASGINFVFLNMLLFYSQK